MAREITYNNFEISLVVFMPKFNITTNHAITYTNQKQNYLRFASNLNLERNQEKKALSSWETA